MTTCRSACGSSSPEASLVSSSSWVIMAALSPYPYSVGRRPSPPLATTMAPTFRSVVAPSLSFKVISKSPAHPDELATSLSTYTLTRSLSSTRRTRSARRAWGSSPSSVPWMCLKWPPSRSERSTRWVSRPCPARHSAALMPASPPPITSARGLTPCAASGSGRCPRSRAAAMASWARAMSVAASRCPWWLHATCSRRSMISMRAGSMPASWAAPRSRRWKAGAAQAATSTRLASESAARAPISARPSSRHR